MPNYSELIADIAAAIYPNGQQEIDAVELRDILTEMVYSLGAGFSFQGVATPDMDPGTPDNNVIYIAGPGTYTAFDGLVVPDGSLGILKYDGSWSLETIEGVGGGSNLTGYVVVDSIAELPDPGQATLGYLVGTNLYLYVGTGGDTLDGKYQNCGQFRGPAGPAGPQGVGFSSITTNEDGTMTIVLTTGETITIDLNHDHPAYPKYYPCEDEAEYNGMATHESDTLYLIPETSA